MYSTLATIAISMLLGIALGCWLTVCSINYLLSRDVMTIFYNGERAEEFRMW